MMEVFKIVEDKNVPDDTLILISPLTMDEVRSCKSMEEVFQVLMRKKKLVVLENLNRMWN